MEEDIRQEIEEMIGHMKCPKNFNCAKNGFTPAAEASSSVALTTSTSNPTAQVDSEVPSP